MEILVVGNEQNIAEFKQKFTAEHSYHFYQDYSFDSELLDNAGAIFDFYICDNPENFEIYSAVNDAFIFVNAPKISLAELAYYQEDISCRLAGFNGIPSFLNRELLEVSLLDAEDSASLDTICQELGTAYSLVDDRVGMVTPRIICMIINEAFFTLQEGTASIEDIDKGMKLGTNYPFGPFEWCDRMGLDQVYELLEAVYDDTKDERYKIAPLLKKEYLKSGIKKEA